MHPCEAYLVLPSVEGISNTAGIYHYSVKEHSLEKRATLGPLWEDFIKKFPKGSFLLGISAIYWYRTSLTKFFDFYRREVWKYGERGFRYTQLDIGHAFSACCISSGMLGWQIHLLPGLSDSSIATLLGLDKIHYLNDVEKEYPALLAIVVPVHSLTSGPQSISISKELLSEFSNLTWNGKANTLSYGHTVWDIVTCVIQRTTKGTEEDSIIIPPTLNYSNDLFALTTSNAATILRSRRSALDFSSKPIMLPQFLQLLARIHPSYCSYPWTCHTFDSSVHIAIFVYRVEGLPSGYYMLLRDNSQLNDLKTETQSSGFKWQSAIPEMPSFPLFLLQEEPDVEKISKAAANASCSQQMVAKAAFCMSMFTTLDTLFEPTNPANTTADWFKYRRAHWECGMIGQVLYTEGT